MEPQECDDAIVRTTCRENTQAKANVASSRERAAPPTCDPVQQRGVLHLRREGGDALT